MEKLDIRKLISSSERIGTIGSPSSTGELALDILGTAVNSKLVGELALFQFSQDGKPHYALGQITEIKLKNIWLEDPTMRSLARQRGQVNPVSGQQDTHLGDIVVSAVFSESGDRFEPSILGTVPATGTFIHLVSDRILDNLLERYRREIFYLGRVYGSTPKLPLWFKHFARGPLGAGEAYHLGIFGKTGSGKSVLAKMILLPYARYRNMALFVIDPQGEFAKGLQVNRKPENMGEILGPFTLSQTDKEFVVYDLSKMRLDRWELLTELLTEFRFFFDMGIKSSEYQSVMADYVEDFLRQNQKYTLSDLTQADFYDVLTFIRDNIHRVYATDTGIDRVREFIEEVQSSTNEGETHPIKEKWDKAVRFFKTTSTSRTASEIVRSALINDGAQGRPLIIVDLSKRFKDISQSVWNTRIKPLLIDRFLDAIYRQAEYAYREGESLNTLILIDEAHRLAPRGRISNERDQRIRSRLIDAVRTTRKFGLGWIFISQTLSSLNKEIIGQLRIFFFGFGLGLGTEFQALREIIGGDSNALKLYQSFRDPHSSFDIESREYAFMTIGPVSPLSFAGTPLFFTAFTKPDKFLLVNGFEEPREKGIRA